MNPLAPKVQMHLVVNWYGAHALNKEAAKNAPNNTDVVFLGDDVIEGWTGLQLGEEVDELKGVHDAFKFRFDVDEGAEYQGVALGAASDKVRTFSYWLCKLVDFKFYLIFHFFQHF